MLSSGCCKRFFSQFFGVILKNIYFRKSILLQSILIYNINIVIILLTMVFTNFMAKYISEVTSQVPGADGAPPPPPPKTNLGMQILQGYFIMATAFIHSPVY